jgi:hypothetical protein
MSLYLALCLSPLAGPLLAAAAQTGTTRAAAHRVASVRAVPRPSVAGRPQSMRSGSAHGAASIGGAGNIHRGAHGGVRDGTAGIDGRSLMRRMPR